MSVIPKNQLRRRRTPLAGALAAARVHGSEPTSSEGSVVHARTSRAACAQCGAAATIHWLAGYQDGKPVRNQICLACATIAPHLLRPIAPSQHMRLDAALLLAGTCVALLGALHDYLPRASGGFGWHQLVGVLSGATVLMLGLLTRVDFLAAGGLVVLAISGTADLLLLNGSAGIGVKQEMMILCGLFAILVGIRLRRQRRRFATRLSSEHVSRASSYSAECRPLDTGFVVS